jgi:hypothetical protein
MRHVTSREAFTYCTKATSCIAHSRTPEPAQSCAFLTAMCDWHEPASAPIPVPEAGARTVGVQAGGTARDDESQAWSRDGRRAKGNEGTVARQFPHASDPAPIVPARAGRRAPNAALAACTLEPRRDFNNEEISGRSGRRFQPPPPRMDRGFVWPSRCRIRSARRSRATVSREALHERLRALVTTPFEHISTDHSHRPHDPATLGMCAD